MLGTFGWQHRATDHSRTQSPLSRARVVFQLFHRSGTDWPSKTNPAGAGVHWKLTVTVVSCNVRFMERKDELRVKALDYCLAHGVAGLSLRPLALKIGTSARLLIYHFGSRDGLIGEVMNEAHRRVQRSFEELIRRPGFKSPLRTFWDWTTDRRNAPYLRLIFEVQVLALQNPTAYARYLAGTSSSWLTVIEAALPSSGDRRARATLCAAIIDGLLLEFLSTGDLERTTSALDIFDSMLRARVPRVGSDRRSVARQNRSKGA